MAELLENISLSAWTKEMAKTIAKTSPESPIELPVGMLAEAKKTSSLHGKLQADSKRAFQPASSNGAYFNFRI